MDHVAPTVCTPLQPPPPTWVSGGEPIAGYRLLEPLGRGGFGEVWKCEAPGGLTKAIKAVNGNNGAGLADQELAALQRVKEIRHPFILSLERVEVVGGVLLIVMELADKNLLDVQAECRALGMPGVPRKELLGLLLEAAEALDWMNFAHGVQHLDVKPHNLFVVSNHIKVADFGLAQSVPEGGAGACHRGTTPLYASPERLRGAISRHCDQYSLAIVYQQLLTGTVPFWSPNLQQLSMKHLSDPPDVSALPPGDQAVVLRALAKDPAQRFPSCLALVQALVRGPEGAGGSDSYAVPGKSAAPSTSSSRPGEVPERTRVLSSAPSLGSLPVPSLPPAQTRLSPDTARAAARTPPAGTQPPAPALSPGTSWDGYQFVERLGQDPLGELWLLRDADDVEYRGLCLHATFPVEDAVIDRLRALHENAELPPTRVLRGPSDRLLVLTDRFERTLAERFDLCSAKGMHGIPRDELLRLLRRAAEALDALHARTGLPHLGLNPRNLLIDGDRLWLTEYGLGSLVWLPSGQPAAQLNSRYAALELFDGPPAASSDQYSLALIYAEMVSGFHPRARVSKPGIDRRGAPARPSAKVDLDLVPACDRETLLRALSPDPARRFDSCTALARALEEALEGSGRSLPPLIPSARLHNPRAEAAGVLPTVGQLVGDLAAEANPALRRSPVLPPREPGAAWEQRYPIRLIPGATALKVRGFAAQWGARVVHEDGRSFVLQLEAGPHDPRGARTAAAKRTVEVRLQVGEARGPRTGLAEVRVSIRPLPAGDPAAPQALDRLAPRLLESLRAFLYASQERRQQERWACPQPVRVYPVRPDRSLGPPVAGVCRNISLSGVQFLVERPLEASQVYLHWHRSPHAAPYALLADVTRVRQIGGADGLEIGAAFAGAGP